MRRPQRRIWQSFRCYDARISKKKATPLCNQVVMAQETVIVHHRMYTNGIDYLTFLFDIRDWKTEELAYLGVLKNVLGYVDTAQHDYAALANEINQKTGGVGSSVGIYPMSRDRDRLGLFFEVRVKSAAHAAFRCHASGGGDDFDIKAYGRKTPV